MTVYILLSSFALPSIAVIFERFSVKKQCSAHCALYLFDCWLAQMMLCLINDYVCLHTNAFDLLHASFIIALPEESHLSSGINYILLSSSLFFII